jgi:hypothetical protein
MDDFKRLPFLAMTKNRHPMFEMLGAAGGRYSVFSQSVFQFVGSNYQLTYASAKRFKPA